MSMSTAIACIYTNRKCICIEKDETYFSQGEKRVRNEYQYL
jgi:DNA modification methylase